MPLGIDLHNIAGQADDPPQILLPVMLVGDDIPGQKRLQPIAYHQISVPDGGVHIIGMAHADPEDIGQQRPSKRAEDRKLQQESGESSPCAMRFLLFFDRRLLMKMLSLRRCYRSVCVAVNAAASRDFLWHGT